MSLILAIGYSRPIIGVTSTYSKWSIDPEFFRGSCRSLDAPVECPLVPFCWLSFCSVAMAAEIYLTPSCDTDSNRRYMHTITVYEAFHISCGIS